MTTVLLSISREKTYHFCFCAEDAIRFKISLTCKISKRTPLVRLLELPLSKNCRRHNSDFNMAAVSSSEDSTIENQRNSEHVSGDLFSEMPLDICAQDFANYIKVDVSSKVLNSCLLLKIDPVCLGDWPRQSDQ